MSYFLGVDVGTTYTAAAVWRDGHTEICELGDRSAVVPTVVFLRDDGVLLIGEAAERRALTDPLRVAREFKRRMGDPVTVLVGGAPFSADALMAKVLRWTVDQVTEREGGPPAGLVVSHPANWGPFKLDLLRQAMSAVDLADSRFVTEPEAAAIHYATQERTAPGTVVAVYDLGGGTFDAAVLRRAETAWEILGQPQGIERLGGVDFDEAVFRRICTTGEIRAAMERLDADEPAARSAIGRLRRDCVAAKEALASDTAVAVPVFLPDLRRDVRLTRSELEDLLRMPLLETIGALERALRCADVATEDVDAVLLVGGSSRLPLVAEIVGGKLGRPVAIDVHPKHAVALGAAIVASRASTIANEKEPPLGPSPANAPDLTSANRPLDSASPEDLSSTDEPPLDTYASHSPNTDAASRGVASLDDPPTIPGGPANRQTRTRWALAAAAAAIVLGAAGVLVGLAGRSDADNDGSPTATTTEPRAAATTAHRANVVPDVVGMTEQQARVRLERAGLDIEITHVVTTDPTEDGIVVAQDPPASRDLDHETRVRLTIGDLQPGSRLPDDGESSTPSATANSSNPGGSDESDTGGNPTPTPSATPTSSTPPTTRSTPVTLPPTPTSEPPTSITPTTIGDFAFGGGGGAGD